MEAVIFHGVVGRDPFVSGEALRELAQLLSATEAMACLRRWERLTAFNAKWR